ncbi:IucA/IucC family protein [Shewanella xiamenensis]|uniref:IucA/IucC family protein n=1 Tax=Shewanella xiamenensis TaxID=332186 RepID=UPI001C4E832F|nr:IucA/IucC family siderophore biosynthesis protein [Shewanella xiamenensis]MBW0282009.1 IucA/IucC family protein [Shewanella xiamenensis]MCT8871615.1 IucA/IucC family siderophore biosynthesis protein [Shewanella xiamenensis]UWH43548.1 IucA/IucC family siderophore biosynthesis protein [Shewanella xiamenensis]
MNLATNRALFKPFTQAEFPTLEAAAHTHVPAHLMPEYWQAANRHLVKKILCEFTHEKIITPQIYRQAAGINHYELRLKDCTYYFSARHYQLDHLDIATDSIRVTSAGTERPLDAMRLIISLKNVLGISETLLPTYLEEITSTLYSKAYKLAHQAIPAATLAKADYQTIEAGMTEGHPVFIANNGRIGFDMQDYYQFAPESASALQLVWIAVRKDKTTFSALEGLDHDSLLKQELGEQFTEFQQHLSALGQAADSFYFMPVHPWQWREKIARTFAGEIARGDIIYLGESQDCYQVQQSIRTFFNLSAPQKCYVKTALSILNMGFMRGLSPLYMSCTPQINAWVAKLIESDSYFAEQGFVILKEIAAIGYHHRYYEEALTQDSAYKKMLSALWRESPLPHIEPQQNLMTMAALLHIDHQEQALIAALIEHSGLSAKEWVTRYLNLYLSPLLHAFFAYDLVFMPHGENLILVLDAGIPVKILMKDIGEEVAVLNGSEPLPQEVQRLAVELEEEMKLNYILLDIFDCIFRYLAPILDKHTEVSEALFWALVADNVRDYQAQHPQLADKFAQYDLFKDSFVRTCLNRIQLNNNQQMIDLADREKNLRFAGGLDNPLAAFRQSHAFGNQKLKPKS